MHTTNWTGETDRNGEATFYMHHNGDYSGDVIVNVPSKLVEDMAYLHAGERHEIRIPFEALKSLVADYVRDKLMAEIENATDDELLTGNYGGDNE